MMSELSYCAFNLTLLSWVVRGIIFSIEVLLLSHTSPFHVFNFPPQVSEKVLGC